MNAIDWLKDIPNRNADREFLIDTISGTRLTFGQMHERATRVGADLCRRGIGRGDRVIALLNNSVAFAELYFGCLYAGAVVIPINPILSEKEIGYILQRAQVKLLVVSAQTARHVDRTVLDKSGADLLVLKDGLGKSEPPEDMPCWDLSTLPDPGRFVPFDQATPEDTIAIVFTSGTTGRPTGVVHRIADLVNNARLFNHRLGIGPDNRFYNVLAMAYLGGYYNLLLLPYVAGSSVVLAHAFDARAALRFWKAAEENGVNTLWLVPTIMAILMEMDRGHKGEEFCRENIRLCLAGTAPLPVKLRKNFEERYGLSVYENYGLCETLFISTNSPDLLVTDGCVGRVLRGVEVAVKDTDGKPVAYGKEGEIYVSTPYLMEGRYDLETQQTSPADTDGFFPSGDIGVLTGAGDVFITGRKKDLIIRGGINISPAQIENVLYRHKAVLECATVGVFHEIYGEDIAVAVCLRKKHKLVDVRDELSSLLKAELGTIKQPAHIIEIDELPKSSTGKIQRNKVRTMLEHKLGIAQAAKTRPSQAAPPKASPMVPGRVRRVWERVDGDLVKEISKFPASIVSDSMNRMGVMDSQIHSLVVGRAFCGTALTVEEVEAGNTMSHVALELIGNGDVLVIDAKGATTRSCWGGLQSLMAKQRGAEAIVINGTIRDLEDVVELGMPVYALGTSPGGPMKGWGGNINYPIACGGVVVNPGDLVMGDDDGVVVVPKDLVKEVISCCRHRSQMEKTWFEKVRSGQSTIDAVGLREKLDGKAIRYE